MRDRGFRAALFVSAALLGCTTLVGLDKDYGLVCEAGTARVCYSGPVNTEKVGSCKSGLQVCNLDGTGYGECIGEVVPRTEDCATAEADEDCDGKALCTGDLLWSNRFGDGKNQYSNSITTDSASNVLLTGDFEGSMDFGGGTLTGAGDRDIFVVKLDPNGDLLWSNRFGNTSDEFGTSITTDTTGNVLLTGRFHGSVDFGGGTLTSSAGSADIFVVKLDPNGNLLWSNRFGDEKTHTGTSITTDSTGNVLLTGDLEGTVDFGGGALTSAGERDIFVAKLDPNGDLLWSNRFGDTHDQRSNSITTDSTGNVLLTGDFDGTVDFGSGTLTSAGVYDVFVAKLDPNGDPLWSNRFGDADYQYSTGITTDSTGNVLLTGYFQGSVDFGGGTLTSAGGSDIFVAKIDPNGDLLWSNHFGDAKSLYGAGIATDSASNVLLTGYFDGNVNFGGGTLTNAGDHDIFVVKLDPDGDLLWSNRFGDADGELGTSITTDSAGNVLLTGYFDGTVDFGDGTLTSAGGRDIFVAKLAP